MPKGKRKKIKKLQYNKIAEEEGGGGTCKTFDEFYKFDRKVNRPNQ
jgi:hypothetical protein